MPCTCRGSWASWTSVGGDRVKVETLGQPLARPRRPFAGAKAYGGCCQHLEEVKGGEQVGLAEGVKNFCIRNSGRGIVVLISDLMDKSGYEPALTLIRSPATWSA